MPKAQDLPTELREFGSLFSILARRHDAARVFDDFLTLVVCALGRQTQEAWYLRTIRKYGEDEINIFPKLLAELVIIYEKAQLQKTWDDPLGSFYEVIAGNYARSGLGQFFTPKSLCSLIAEMTMPKEFGMNISDPACGSGRMLLAAHNHQKGNYYVATDLDNVCVKMCCINLALHGIRAEVHHANSLGSEPPYSSYAINPDFYKTQTPFILKVK